MRLTLFCSSASRFPANIDATAMIEKTSRTRAAIAGPGLIEVAQQKRKHRAFGDGGHKSGDRRRCALVDVRRPHMKGNQRELEADAHEDESDADGEDGPDATPGRAAAAANLPEFHRAQLEIDQRHSKQKERRRCGGEDQVLYARFDRDLQLALIGDQSVKRDAKNLKPEEERGKVAGAHQRGRTKGGDRDQNVQLLWASVFLALEIPVAKEHHGDAAGEDQSNVEKRAGVDAGSAA